MVKNSQLIHDINEIVKNGDLDSLSSKKIRKMLEEKHETDLSDMKKEIDEMIMFAIEEKQTKDEKDKQKKVESSSDSDSDFYKIEDNLVVNKKTKKAKALSDEGFAKQLQDEEDNSTRRRTRAGGAKVVKKKIKRKSTDADGEPKKKRKSVYSKECLLSPALANLLQAEKMPRSEVIKRIWQMVKDRDLYDPKNRQFMLCDEELQKVFGRKRVKTFGMMKYLKDHIHDPDLVVNSQLIDE